MTHPSVNSIVERLRERVTHFYDGGKSAVSYDPDLIKLEAATIISELQAQNERKDRLIQVHQQQIIDAGEIMKHWQDRALTAESSLSRIKAETIEALKPFADALQDVDDAARDDWHLWESPAAMNLSVGDLRRANTAIRSLGSTGGGEKTAESEHSPSTPTTATE